MKLLNDKKFLGELEYECKGNGAFGEAYELIEHKIKRLLEMLHQPNQCLKDCGDKQ